MNTEFQVYSKHLRFAYAKSINVYGASSIIQLPSQLLDEPIGQFGPILQWPDGSRPFWGVFQKCTNVQHTRFWAIAECWKFKIEISNYGTLFWVERFDSVWISLNLSKYGLFLYIQV